MRATCAPTCASSSPTSLISSPTGLDGTLLIVREIAKIAGKRARGRVFGLLVPAGFVQQDALLKGGPGMTLEFTVGMNIAGVRRSVIVSAGDALIAALKVKHQHPEASINYVRRSNRRGDRRHPHKSSAEA
jgi:hypothetical protein